MGVSANVGLAVCNLNRLRLGRSVSLDWMHLCRPITGRRGHVAEHLYKAGARAQHGKLDTVKDGLRKGLKYAVGGAVFYFAVSLALGGRDRVKHDLEVIKVILLLL